MGKVRYTWYKSQDASFKPKVSAVQQKGGEYMEVAVSQLRTKSWEPLGVLKKGHLRLWVQAILVGSDAVDCVVEGYQLCGDLRKEQGLAREAAVCSGCGMYVSQVSR